MIKTKQKKIYFQTNITDDNKAKQMGITKFNHLLQNKNVFEKYFKLTHGSCQSNMSIRFTPNSRMNFVLLKVFYLSLCKVLETK